MAARAPGVALRHRRPNLTAAIINGTGLIRNTAEGMFSYIEEIYIAGVGDEVIEIK